MGLHSTIETISTDTLTSILKDQLSTTESLLYGMSILTATFISMEERIGKRKIRPFVVDHSAERPIPMPIIFGRLISIGESLESLPKDLSTPSMEKCLLSKCKWSTLKTNALKKMEK